MSEVEFIKNLLERDWASSTLPQPNFVLEKKERETNLRTQDTGYLTSGADTVHSPRGPAWTSRQSDTAVLIEYRAASRVVDTEYADPYDRLFGQRTGSDGVSAPDRYDGIVGETKRILENARNRTGGYRRVGSDSGGSPIRVERPEPVGVNYYQANVLVPLESVTLSIDTSV